MKMEQPSEFDKIRKAAKSVEDAMENMNNILNNPIRIFDSTKCVESEKLVEGEIQSCKIMIAEVADTKYEIQHNFEATDNFLKGAKDFAANLSSALQDFEAYLVQFGYKKPHDSIVEDDSPATTSDIGTPATGIDTSGIQELEDSEDSPDKPRFSNGTAKLYRELSFDH